MTGPEGPAPKPELRGEVLAANMVEQLILLNKNLESLTQIGAALHEMADTLCGHFDVVHRAMELSTEMEGKVKITIVDFAKRWVEAADEILPEEDEEEDGDVLAGRR